MTSKFTNITNNQEVVLTITLGYMEFKSQFYGLSEKKRKNARRNGFIFNQINQLTKNVYSNLSNTNIHLSLQLEIPILHRHFLKISCHNPEYVKNHCKDRNNPFHFACRKWYSYNNPQCSYSIITPIQINYSHTCTNTYNCTYSNTSIYINILILEQILCNLTFSDAKKTLFRHFYK